jgi:hypothetical protein
MIDLDAIRARDRDYDDVFEAQANMSKDIAHRLVAWPVADRRDLLAYVDALRAAAGKAYTAMTDPLLSNWRYVESGDMHGDLADAAADLRRLLGEP